MASAGTPSEAGAVAQATASIRTDTSDIAHLEVPSTSAESSPPPGAPTSQASGPSASTATHTPARRRLA
eukprot:11332399-Prorocentrum_lima.AAC.1